MGVGVAYYGGRVLSNVAIVAVFWTSNVAVDLQQQVGSFYTAIASSSYIDWLEEYDTLGLTGVGGKLGSDQHIGRGKLTGAFTITPSTSATTLDDGDIASELAAQIAAGSLPAPTLDSAGNVNTVYMVEIPPGYTVTLLGGMSCTDFCAYHSTVSVGGKSVPYAVLPDSQSCVGAVCGQGFDDETILRSHELAEAITDTESGLVSAADIAAGKDVYPMAWAGDGGTKGEIGDLCFQGFVGDHDEVAGYEVQKLWSTFAGACVVGVPICVAGVTPPACRPCTAYDNGAACSAPTTVCEEATGTCRACEGLECSAMTDAGSGADAGLHGVSDADAGAGATDAGPGETRVRAGCGVTGAGAAGVDAWLLVTALGWTWRRRRRGRLLS
jgi:hypothetical protein